MSRKWINFFTDAGIPSTAAASYALIFSENRISENMLLDLDREVLKEMGIQTMGDVISILKHARYVYEKTARDSVLQSSTKDKVEKPVKKTLVSTVSVPENDPYFYSPSSELKKASEEKKALRKEGPVLPPSMKLSSKVSSSSSNHQNSDTGSSGKSTKDIRILKRKIKTSVQKGVLIKEETDESDSSSSSSSSSSLECVSKYRKVLPEPSKSTSSSSPRMAAAKPFGFSNTKRTVSILDKEPEIIPKSGTTFTITMSGSQTPAKPLETVKKSVFSRLDSKLGSGVTGQAASHSDPEYSEAREKNFPFDDDGLQPTVEIINDLYTPAVEPYVKSDGRVLLEPVARVKPIIQTEGILAKPSLKLKPSPRERLGVTGPSEFRSHPSLSLYNEPYDTISSSFAPQNDGVRNISEAILDDDVFYSNGASKKVHFAEILEKKVSIPSMDYETMNKPSVKNRITFNQGTTRVGGMNTATVKPPLTRKERFAVTTSMSAAMDREMMKAQKHLESRISLKPSVRERISLKSPASVRSKMGIKSAPSVRERIGVKPSPSFTERISLQSTPSVRERISLNPTGSVRERISLKSTASVRERISVNSTPSIRERISLKPTASVRERISMKSTPSIRERISLKSLPTARERISLKPTASVRERISMKPSSSVRERISISSNFLETNSSTRINRGNLVSVKSSVKDRLAHKGVSQVKPRVVRKGMPPVKARLGKPVANSVRKKLSSNKQLSKTSNVFSRLG